MAVAVLSVEGMPIERGLNANASFIVRMRSMWLRAQVFSRKSN